MFQRSQTSRFSLAALVGSWRWNVVLPKTVDLSLAALFIFAPLVWGGRGEIARLVYASLVSIAAVAWLANAWLTGRSIWRWTPVLLIPVAAITWVVLQLVPLPEAVIQWLAPRNAELLPLWQGESALAGYGLGTWRTLSLNPTESQVSLALLLAYTLLAAMLIDRLKSREKVDELLGWMGISAIAMAALGVLQYLTSDGLFFWVYEYPFRRSDQYAVGAFINHNHFASFIAMGAAAIAYQLVREAPQPLTRTKAPQNTSTRTAADYRTIGWAIGLGVVALALVMSASRGGVLAAAVGVAVILFVYWRRNLFGGRQLIYSAVAAALLGVMMSLIGEEQFTERLESITSGSAEELDELGARRAIWSANLRAIADNWLTGSGAGTHKDIYPAYIDQPHTKVFSHAENGYLQIATELGLPGVVLLVAVLVSAARWTVMAWRRCESREQLACLGAMLAALAVSISHSLVDFVWFIPATMTMALACLLVLRRLAVGGERDSDARGMPYDLAVATCVAIVFTATVLVPPAMASGAWTEYRRLSNRQGLETPETIAQYAKTGDATSFDGQQRSALAMHKALRQVVELNPRSAEAHLRLARIYLRLFDARSELRENRMELGQYQSAVVSGGFDSTEQLREWLARAVGDDVSLLLAARHHTIESIRYAPLEADGYIWLANLDFLDNPTSPRAEPLLSQALQLGPQDGSVQYEVGKLYGVVGNDELALNCWKRAFELPGQHQKLVAAAIAGQQPPAELLVEEFKPDWTTLPTIWQRYLAGGDEQQLQLLLDYATELAETYEPKRGETPTAYVWKWLGEMNSEIGNVDQQIACLRRAVEENGTLLTVRKSYAVALYDAERYAEAEPHLRWCLARDSVDKGIRKKLAKSAVARRKQAVNPFTPAGRFPFRKVQ